MYKAFTFTKGDNVAIVSLSSGILGDKFCAHQLKLGVKRLKEIGLNPVFMKNALKGKDYLRKNPKARADDFKEAFLDNSISGIICAIGGDDTYKIIPWLLEDYEFINAVKSHPKIFTGFSDSTVNHLLLNKLGLITFYGPNFLNDIAELGNNMLPYTLKYFLGFFNLENLMKIVPSKVWYEERKDFSSKSIGTERICHQELRGFELLQGKKIFSGILMGGCIDSLYSLISVDRYPDEKDINDKYELVPIGKKWSGKILFLETSESKITPEDLEIKLNMLKDKGIFNYINGIIVGKPQDEVYYDEYKSIYKKVVQNIDLPIMYNVNFGHAYPRTILPLGINVKVDANKQCIQLLEQPLYNIGEKSNG